VVCPSGDCAKIENFEVRGSQLCSTQCMSLLTARFCQGCMQRLPGKQGGQHAPFVLTQSYYLETTLSSPHAQPHRRVSEIDRRYGTIIAIEHRAPDRINRKFISHKPDFRARYERLCRNQRTCYGERPQGRTI